MARESQRQFVSSTDGLLQLGSEAGHGLLVIIPHHPDLPVIEGFLGHGTCCFKKYIFYLVSIHAYNMF